VLKVHVSLPIKILPMSLDFEIFGIEMSDLYCPADEILRRKYE
jgi:hypothetical protein